jgi:hypothetical protein
VTPHVLAVIRVSVIPSKTNKRTKVNWMIPLFPHSTL